MGAWRHALSWFPGHVAKASSEMATRLKHVDIVIEVRDARAPRSTASSHLHRIVQQAARSQQRLIVVNKADLVSAGHRREITGWMADDHPGVPLYFTSAMDGAGGHRGVSELLDAAVERVRESAPRLFKPSLDISNWPTSPTARAISQAASSSAGRPSMGPPAAASLPLVMMIVGVPNVGKSSLINAFRRLSTQRARAAARRGSAIADRSADRRVGARSAKPARTGAVPGVTTALGGFQVSWEPSVFVLDTPGVLSPRVDGGWEAALRLGVVDLIKYDHGSIEPLAAYAPSTISPSPLGCLLPPPLPLLAC